MRQLNLALSDTLLYTVIEFISSAVVDSFSVPISDLNLNLLNISKILHGNIRCRIFNN